MGVDLSKRREACLKGIGSLSKEQIAHLKEIGQIVRAHKIVLQSRGEIPTKKGIQELLEYIWQNCPAYPPYGSLNIKTWTNIGSYFHEEPRAPTPILINWKSVLIALCLHHGNTVTPSKKQADELTPLNPTAPPKYEDVTIETEGRVERESKEEILQQTPQEEKSNIPPKNEKETTEIVEMVKKEIATEIVEKIKEGIIQQAPQEEKSNIYPVLNSECPYGPLTTGIEKARSGDNVKLEDLKMMAAFPVDFTGQNPVHTPLPPSVLKDLKSAITTYGLLSPYVQGLFANVADNYVMLPLEWYSMAKAVLSMTQAMLWKAIFREQCAVLHGTNANFPVAQLQGSGNFKTQAQQMAIPRDSLKVTGKAAVFAFGHLDDMKSASTSNFISIRQENGEPYSTFIERLQTVVNREIDNAVARKELMIKLAFENTNEDCRRVLEPLRGDSTKRLVDYLRKASVIRGLMFQ
ncbi:endogenous retrovirus group K member 5 Gag polyprotein-like [Thamnophis elegans]|uniref:endogenous retrovirus group K member 5 Gag polyprotein-like n=1 Tax=Thamnophis elegans TaxID=35005 RepID=UPI001377E6DD|nr:endogenous retrovirus group K member 5 Gag polyprotein-like [Thamnophis elegans]